MAIDRSKYGVVYHYINETFWPLRYAHLHRYADFQNRALAKYWRTQGLDFIHFTGSFPKDPAFFAGAIHPKPEGMKLQVRVILQQLVPLLRRRIEEGVLPRPDRRPVAEHPAFTRPRRQQSVDRFGLGCSAAGAR